MPTDLVRIERIVAGGDGLGRRPDGRVVFVPRTSPDDQVEVEYVEEHPQWSRGRALRVVEAGPDRREAPCRHYARCGACQLQHLSYDAQLRAKVEIARDSLRRLGGVDLGAPEIVASPNEFGYRNRLTFVLRRNEDGAVAGYHAYDDPEEIIDVDGCPLAEDAVGTAWGALRAAWGPGAQLLPPGDELRLMLRATAGGEVGLVIEGADDHGDLEAVLERTEGLASIHSLGPDGRTVQSAGPTALDEAWGSQAARITGSAFLQVNREVAMRLEEYVLAQCEDVRGKRAIDAYCGLGLRALKLAELGAKVTAIDTDRRAIAAARASARERGFPARFVRAPVERALARELPAHVVIVNPTRRGLARPAAQALLERPPTRVVYVSCDPATLARDLQRLSASFELQAFRIFDMFPQTAHVETVVTLQRRTDT